MSRRTSDTTTTGRSRTTARRTTSQEPRAPRTASTHQPRRGAAQPATEPQRGGIGGLFRGAGNVLGQVSGMDAPARALERLAASAEHAADFLDRLDAEVGLDRAARLVDRLDHLADVVEDMHNSLLEIEARVVELDRRGRR
jgi:hypothetical protein